ncbi:MAG: GNAT family N-acetyltransferase [Anaerolineae bacterium]|jgi:predicted N-acetyltransferase YhbS|nr:GNAT family N-acetyltransferase [Anaerolineae bacterium]MBT3713755.1 GNAT family N-acetyltransferase [Anaerolineae bacterium]MBT4309869.1 GNAT family N-acetyltransferase [Anaerolineae bacterium]MBT4457516.1 GNAT family N-acetyltransferase [Anaerolineae bacterium]MBT4843619.1 GNAT family N-acetyltransferase [Anaerolineae bacterium]
MIEYKTGTEIINWESLVDLYFETDGVIGLGRERDLATIKKAFLNTYKIVTAWDADKIIGAVRLLSDGVCYGWIHDMSVHPDFQKKGIGQELINELMKGDENLLFGLTAAFGSEEFYYKLGFKRHKSVMAKYPGESIYLED